MKLIEWLGEQNRFLQFLSISASTLQMVCAFYNFIDAFDIKQNNTWIICWKYKNCGTWEIHFKYFFLCLTIV